MEKSVKKKPFKKIVLKKGTLSVFGYSSKIKVRERKEALTRAVEEYGYAPVIKKISVLCIFNKNKPEMEKVFCSDKKWLMRTFNPKSKSIRKKSKRKSVRKKKLLSKIKSVKKSRRKKSASRKSVRKLKKSSKK
jgi:hypothetical protein